MMHQVLGADKRESQITQQLENYLMQYHYICIVKALIAVY